MYNVFNIESYRNSGFMWEPGAFAFILILAIIIRILKINKLDKKITIYSFLILTTFSTMGYIVLFLIYSTFLFDSKNIFKALVIFLITILFVSVYQFDFIFSKINEYFVFIDYLKPFESYQGENYLRVNRFAYFKIAIESSFAWPFGNGILISKYIISTYGYDVQGVGTFSSHIIIWGWIGLLYYVKYIYQFISNINLSKVKFITKIIFTIAIFFSLFTNPMEKSPLFFIIFFYGFLYKINLDVTKKTY